jgi:hypothetical protein
MSFKAINEFFTAFLENHGDEEILSKWKEESKGLNKIMKKKEKKEKKKSSGLSKNKSAYIFFCLEERAEIAKENPELSSKEITKILAKNWSDLKENDEDRLAELQEKALKDKERYTKEKSDSENEKSDGEDNNTTEPKKKKKKTSLYMLFCKEERAVIKEEFPEYSSKEIITELGRRWTELKSSKSDKMGYYENLKKQQDSDEEEVVVEKEEEEVVVEKEEVVVEDEEEEEIKPKKKASKKKKIVEDDEDVVEEEEVKPKKKATKKKSA